MSLTQTQALKHRSALLEEKIELQQKKLREGGLEAWKGNIQTCYVFLICKLCYIQLHAESIPVLDRSPL